MDLDMEIQELLRLGRLEDARTALTQRLQRRPDRGDDWVLLAAVEGLGGAWDRVAKHLQTAALLDPSWVPAVAVLRRLVAAEHTRREVFAGRQAPGLLGEPPEWLAWRVEAMAMEGRGEVAAARELRALAAAQCGGFPATVDGQSVEGLTDADDRLGPVLEIFLDGGYYWLPCVHWETLRSEPPASLMDLIWLPVQVRLVTGGEVAGHLPVRYPGTESVDDPALKMARLTDWRRTDTGGEFPLGQRLWVAKGAEFGLLEFRSVERRVQE